MCVCLPPAGPSDMIKHARLRSANVNTRTHTEISWRKWASSGLVYSCGVVERPSISSLSQTQPRGDWAGDAADWDTLQG